MKNTRGLKKIQEPRNNIQFIVYPNDREALKPFVFFDAGTMVRADDALNIHAHPHSGIGIITYFEGTDLHHGDSGKNDGIIRSGGVQWIRAGGGVWHEESYRRIPELANGKWEATLHQLWLQLPPELEESEVEYANFQPEEIPVVENVKISAGTYKNTKGKLIVPFNLTYLDVELEKNKTWEFNTLPNQTRGFVFLRKGEILVGDSIVPNQKMGILENNQGTINIETQSEIAKFVLVLVEPSSHPLVISRSSIHTNEAALERSMKRINEIGMAIHH